MIIQGSNNPLVIQFDTSVEEIPVLVVTLWNSNISCQPKMIKRWDASDMIIDEDTAICPLDEDDTRRIHQSQVVLEAKGLDTNGNTIFWDEYKLDIKARRDSVIKLTQTSAEQTEG